jgi:hypothetical protein
MAVDPINGSNVKGNDYLQKNSQRTSDGKSISKNQTTPPSTTINTNNTKSASVNPVSTSMNTDKQNNMTNQSSVNFGTDSLDLSAQAKNAYDIKTQTNNEIKDGPKNTIKNPTDVNMKTPKDSYNSQEAKVYKK